MTILGRQRERFEKQLEGLHKGQSKKGYDKVVERLGRLKERYSRAARQYDVRVEKQAAAEPAAGMRKRAGRRRSELAGTVTWMRNAQHAGRDQRACTYVPRTSHAD